MQSQPPSALKMKYTAARLRFFRRSLAARSAGAVNVPSIDFLSCAVGAGNRRNINGYDYCYLIPISRKKVYRTQDRSNSAIPLPDDRHHEAGDGQ